MGNVPAAFEQEVRRLPLPGPSGRTVVTDRDGEDVMSFVFSELRRDRIFRADYIYVRPSRFVARKRAYCAQRKRALRYRLASYPFSESPSRRSSPRSCSGSEPSAGSGESAVLDDAAFDPGGFQGAAARAKGLQSARSQRRSPQAAQRGST